MKKIVVIGGGSGSSVVLNGLKQNLDFELSAIVVVTDSGGSTGRLRDEFGFLPVGDIRQCIAALADGEYSEEIRKMLLYRFKKGEGLRGHNLGNLILTAFEDIYDSPGQAIEMVTKMFCIGGKVIPVTEKQVDLVIEYEDGKVLIGEKTLDDPKNGGQKIKKIKLSPNAPIYHQAKKAILDADVLIMGPGDLYASILPCTKTKGFKKAIKQSKAKIIYNVNLMTHYAQTHNMTAQCHIEAITKHIGRSPDFVIINKEPIPTKILNYYKAHKEFPVQDNVKENSKFKIYREKLTSNILINQKDNDTVPRSILRHDSQKLAKVIAKIII